AEAVVHWNLSHCIAEAVRVHETPDRNLQGGSRQTLSNVIFLAKRFASELGYWPFFAVDHDESIEDDLVSMGIDILALETEFARALPTLNGSPSGSLKHG